MNKVPKACKDNQELNPITGRCRKKCNENEVRDEKTGRCRKKCKENEVRDEKTRRCKKVAKKASSKKASSKKASSKKASSKKSSSKKSSKKPSYKKASPKKASSKKASSKKASSKKASSKKASSNPKTVFVICSTISGVDFLTYNNQIMLKQLLGEDFIPVFMNRGEKYPDNLPINKKFDAVYFAGCNMLKWLFKENYEHGMEKLSNILKEDGIVIFTESKHYVEKIATKGNYYELSIPLEEMKIYGIVKDDGTGLKQDILKSWGKFFRLDRIDNYFVYKVR